MTSAGFGSSPSCQREKSVREGGKQLRNKETKEAERKNAEQKRKESEKVKGRVLREVRQRRAVVDITEMSIEKSEKKNNSKQPMKQVVQEADLLLLFQLVVHVARLQHCQGFSVSHFYTGLSLASTVAMKRWFKVGLIATRLSCRLRTGVRRPKFCFRALSRGPGNH